MTFEAAELCTMPIKMKLPIKLLNFIVSAIAARRLSACLMLKKSWVQTLFISLSLSIVFLMHVLKQVPNYQNMLSCAVWSKPSFN